MRGFDPLVPFYDLLAAIVFLGEINRSQKFLISSLKRGSKVLILGGGTGKLLEYLDPSIRVTYVELSEKMIKRARNRDLKAKVDFVHQDFLKWKSEEKFDYILCPFFLDLFSDDKLKELMVEIQNKLSYSGQLRVVDFHGESKNLFHKTLLKIMFFFFSFAGAIEITHYNQLFQKLESSFRVNKLVKRCYFGFIKVVYLMN